MYILDKIIFSSIDLDEFYLQLAISSIFLNCIKRLEQLGIIIQFFLKISLTLEGQTGGHGNHAF